MKRYNFDKIPTMASGLGVHAETKKQAWGKVYRLAKTLGYEEKLKFRDNVKCPEGGHYKCGECYPQIIEKRGGILKRWEYS